VSSPVVIRRSELGLLSRASHLLYKVSSSIVIRRSELGLLSWPSHLLFKVSSLFIGGRILLQLRCFKVASKFSTTMWTWERLLPLITWKEKAVVHSLQSSISISMFGSSAPFWLTAPPTPTLFGVFAFQHIWSPFITGVCTPSIRCLYNSSSFHPCMYWKDLRLLSSSRAQETSCCTTSNSLCSELHLGTLLLLAPVVSL